MGIYIVTQNVYIYYKSFVQFVWINEAKCLETVIIQLIINLLVIPEYCKYWLKSYCDMCSDKEMDKINESLNVVL